MKWYRLASHLKMPLQRCQRETSSSEFVEWDVFLNEHADRIEYYLAQIAAEVRRSIPTKQSRRVRVDQFLIKFLSRKVESIESGTDPEWSKACWFAAMGMDPKNPNKKAKSAKLPDKVKDATKAYYKGR